MNNIDELMIELRSRGPMYMGWMSIDRMFAFIRGWSLGKGGDAEKQCNDTLRDFRVFLCDTYNIPDCYALEHVLTCLSGGDYNTEYAFQLYGEYKDSCGQ